MTATSIDWHALDTHVDAYVYIYIHIYLYFCGFMYMFADIYFEAHEWILY